MGDETIKVIPFRLCKLEFVKKLPPINISDSTPRFVYWYSPEEVEGATGDGQVWVYFPNSNKYVPLQKLTLLSGVPEVEQ